MINSKLYIPVVLLLFLAAIGCNKMDSTYTEFLKDGEVVYVNKADSLKAYVGRERIQLQWLLISDPKVKKYKVFWNNRADSVEGTLLKTEKVDTVRVMISNLPEGSYNFEVIQYDNNGNASIRSQVVGRSYGALYAGSIYNRGYKSIERLGTDVRIEWSEADETILNSTIQYVDDNNVSHTLVVPASDNLVTIPSFPQSGHFSYTTTYAPDTLFVDTFLAPTEVIEEIQAERKVDKAKYAHLPLPSDTYEPEFATWGIQNLWDGISNHVDHIFFVKEFLPNLQLPNWFTIDLSGARMLTKVRVNQLSHADGWLFSAGAPKTYEIYGSNDPASDGSFDDWHLLGSFESTKPSNGPGLTQADIDLGRAGEYQVFSGNSEYYRYVRFKVNSTWGGVKNVMLSELTFYEIGSAFRKKTN